MTYLTHQFDFFMTVAGIGAAREGCKIVAGGSQTTGKRSIQVDTPEGCQTSYESQEELAPLQGAN
jgi:hypothetical protein